MSLQKLPFINYKLTNPIPQLFIGMCHDLGGILGASSLNLSFGLGVNVVLSKTNGLGSDAGTFNKLSISLKLGYTASGKQQL